MGSAVTIVLAREICRSPARDERWSAAGPRGRGQEAIFFANRGQQAGRHCSRFQRCAAFGADTVMTVRRRSAVPILVVSNPAHAWAKEYRSAGAVDCVSAPVDRSA